MKLATAEQMRNLDRQAIEHYRIPSVDLMERAAEGLCASALNLLRNKAGKCRAAVFCGSGNNGGDGIAAARLLFLSGVKTRVFLAGSYEKLTPDALEMTRRLSECGVELEPFDPASDDQKNWTLRSDLLVDALFGIGLCREIDPDSLSGAAVQWMNDAPGNVVAADIASGVAADTGNILGLAVRADETVTFTLPKIGHYAGDGGAYSGRVRVHDIGIPKNLVRELVCSAQLTEPDFVRASLPRRKPEGHKGNFGKLLVVGGSGAYSGAPYLTAESAQRTGCGLVFLGVPQNIWAVEAQKCVGPMPFALPADKNTGILTTRAQTEIERRLDGCDVLALGPGLGRSTSSDKLVQTLLRRTEKPVILDADGINAISGHIDCLDARRGRVTILTPHDGEFARLGGDLSHGSRVQTARDFAMAHGCILVLKGHRTVIAAPQGNVLVNDTGNSGLAKGGSGDVLTGIIASLLCQGATPLQAAACGVWLHGRAGEFAAAELTEYCTAPADVIRMLPRAFQTVLSDTTL
jgi:NAD(P)H-hydrate epimerase